MTAVCFGLVLTICVLGCVSDARSLRIPNAYSVIVIAAFAAAYVSTPDIFDPLWHYLGAFAAMFVVTLVLYAAGLFGGGDTKLGSALALWVGLKGLMVYLLYMAIIGGVLSILAIVIKKYNLFKNAKSGSWPAELRNGRNAVPYGIALCISAAMTFFHTGILSDVLNELSKIIL